MDFVLTTNWEYRGGNVMYSDLGRQMTFTGSGKWTEQRAPFVVPNASYNDGTGKFVPNDKAVNEAEYDYWVTYYRVIAENFVVPAWFIKLRDINLTYNLPNKLVSKLRVLSGISFTNGNGLGVSTTTQTPPVKQYGVTLSVNFK
jgi:hypothetical protein